MSFRDLTPHFPIQLSKVHCGTGQQRYAGAKLCRERLYPCNAQPRHEYTSHMNPLFSHPNMECFLFPKSRWPR